MGFMDDLGKYLGEKYNSAVDDYQKASNVADRLDNKKLVNRFKDEKNIAKKMAYGNELKRRKEAMESGDQD